MSGYVLIREGSAVDGDLGGDESAEAEYTC